MKATIETLKDALGNEVFRVSRIFPNASSAHRGAISLDAINPEAFNPFAKGEAFDPPEVFTDSGEVYRLEPDGTGFLRMKKVLPPNCDGMSSGEYRAQLQADSAEGDLDPRAVQAGIEGAGT